jgi:hypothetical protein
MNLSSLDSQNVSHLLRTKQFQVKFHPLLNHLLVQNHRLVVLTKLSLFIYILKIANLTYSNQSKT